MDPPGSNYTPQWSIELATNVARGQAVTLSTFLSLIKRVKYIRAYILFHFYGQGKEEKIMKCVNLSHVSLLCIQAGGVGARNIFPREIVWGGSLLPPLPSNSIISPTPDDDDPLFMLLIKIIMRLV